MGLLDVAIVGGGPVGATLAAWLRPLGLEVAVFEARGGPMADARTLALSHASREALEEVDGWPSGATAIATIHVSQRGGPGRTLIDCRDLGLPALGYTVAYAALEAALSARLEEAGLPIRYRHACSRIEADADGVTLGFEAAPAARARLLVLADGGANAGRVPGLAFREKDYGQVAVVGGVHADRPHGHRAYERFTPQGPMALLPVDDRYGFVWTATPDEGERLKALPPEAFLAELQAAFGDRAGRFTAVQARASFPLRLRTINTPIAPRTVVIGNAAQVLHPIAGQGLNLGLRDARELANLLAGASPESIGGPGLLEAYRSARQRDAGRGVAFTDLLVSSFADASRVMTWGRGLALTAFDLLPSARRILADRMIQGAPGR